MMIVYSINCFKNFIDPMLGDDSNKKVIDYIANEIQKGDHPPYGSDWGDFINDLDLEMIWSMLEFDADKIK